MIRFAALIGLLLALLGSANAQERLASVQLEDGRHLEGRVLSMNLKLLEIEVGGQVLKIPATQIRSCRFQESEDPATQALRETENAANPEGPVTAQPLSSIAATVSAGVAPIAESGAAAPVANSSVAAVGGNPSPTTVQPSPGRVTWSRPIQDPVDPDSLEAVPVDLRRSHWQRRINMLDAAYPWLAPAAPSQWISLGLLLLVGAGLIVHLSVHIAGAEDVVLGRSFALGICYLVTGLGQVAIVPINDLSMVLMLLLNSTLALFGLVSLFDLPRIGAVIALLVQLGFGVLVYGILELVTALLGSVGVAP